MTKYAQSSMSRTRHDKICSEWYVKKKDMTKFAESDLMFIFTIFEIMHAKSVLYISIVTQMGLRPSHSNTEP